MRRGPAVNIRDVIKFYSNCGNLQIIEYNILKNLLRISAQLVFTTSQFWRTSSVVTAVPPQVSLARLQGLGAAVTPRPFIRTDGGLRRHSLPELALALRITLDLGDVFQAPLIVLLIGLRRLTLVFMKVGQRVAFARQFASVQFVNTCTRVWYCLSQSSVVLCRGALRLTNGPLCIAVGFMVGVAEETEIFRWRTQRFCGFRPDATTRFVFCGDHAFFFYL